MLGILLRKQITEKLSFFKKGKARVDILGILISLALLVAVITLTVIVLSKFVTGYCAIRINGVADIVSRQYEILTLIYGIVFIIGVISGIRAVNFAVFESDDAKILLTMPIKASTVFYAKLITVYLKQVVVFAFILLPINLTFAVVTAQSAYYVIMTLLLCLVFPVITLACSAVLSLPVFYIKRYAGSKYALILIAMTVVTGLLFWAYSMVLDFIKALITTGEIKFFFSEVTMNSIMKLSRGLFPVNALARVLLKIETGKNIGIVIATLIAASGISFATVAALFNNASQLRVAAHSTARSKKVSPSRPTLLALIGKEFTQVYRTPGYAFQYFSMAAVMPLMVYFCMGIGTDLLQTLVFYECNFQLAIFVILMFGALTNTFCATNISREGSAFFTMKTLPISTGQIISSKMIFCSVVSLISTIASCIVVSALNYTTSGETAFLFFAALLLSEAQICFATRRDLNRPVFPSDEDCEVRESYQTISEIIVCGLLVAGILGGVTLYFSVYYGSLKGQNSDMQSMLFVGLSAIAIFAAAVAYLLVGLKQKMYELSEGN